MIERLGLVVAIVGGVLLVVAIGAMMGDALSSSLTLP